MEIQQYPREVAFQDRTKYVLDQKETDGKKSFEFTAEDTVENKTVVVASFESEEEANLYAESFAENL